jgi:hypothetical protein
MIGGFVAVNFMSDPSNVAINPDTIEQLATYGIDANGKLAPEIFLVNKFSRSPKGLAILLVGGLLIALVHDTLVVVPLAMLFQA